MGPDERFPIFPIKEFTEGNLWVESTKLAMCSLQEKCGRFNACEVGLSVGTVYQAAGGLSKIPWCIAAKE